MFTNLATTCLFASAIAALPTTSNTLGSRQIPTEPCASGVHLIVAGGDGPDNVGRYGLIKSLSDGILATIPDSTSVQVPYDKASLNGVAKISGGAELMKSYVQDYHNACPSTKLVLIGYSAGAYITMNSICGPTGSFTTQPLDPNYADSVIATIVYGDLSRLSGQSYDLGTCTTSGRFPRQNPQNCAPFSNNLQSYCDFDDPQCCVPGTNATVHFTYPAKYDTAAVEYVRKQYESSLKVASTSSTTTVAKPTTTSTSQSSTRPTTPSSTQATSQSPKTTTTQVTISSTAQSTAQSTTKAISPAVAAPTASSPAAAGKCPVNLAGPFEFPHLIITASKSAPDTAFGMSYNGKIGPDTESLFNFDVPASTSGKTCSLQFYLPKMADLTTSSYTVSGSGGFELASLKTPALQSTTYNTVPVEAQSLGHVDVAPGGAVEIFNGPCPAGAKVGYKMTANDSYALEWFQNSGSPPIGLFMRVC